MIEYKNTIIQRLVDNQNICKAAYYPDPDFLSMPDIFPEDVLYANIFPYHFVPHPEESMETKQTYVSLSMKDFGKAGSVYFTAGHISVSVIAHNDLLATEYGFTRTDYVIAAIDEMLNGERGIGIGKLEFAEMNEIIVNDYYQGSYLNYRVLDFN